MFSSRIVRLSPYARMCHKHIMEYTTTTRANTRTYAIYNTLSTYTCTHKTISIYNLINYILAFPRHAASAFLTRVVLFATPQSIQWECSTSRVASDTVTATATPFDPFAVSVVSNGDSAR